jgi:hypothetical protein
MTLLLAMSIGLAEIQHGAGPYTVFPPCVRAQYVAWAMSLVGLDNRVRDIYR